MSWTSRLAGPAPSPQWCLSDFGAEVIKVEPPAGDPYREFPQHFLWNRGKKSVVLDLETDEGRAKAQQLAAQADVVIESFAPGQADALGIGYDTLSALRPDLVYCSISAFGPKGSVRQLQALRERRRRQGG